MPSWSSRSLAWRASQSLATAVAASMVATTLPVPALHAQAAPEASTPSAYERAMDAYLEADFASARRLLEQALSEASTETHELAMSHALLSVLMETEGAPNAGVEAQIDFAVSIDRTVAVPPGASRAFTHRFEDVRAARRADPPTLQIEAAHEMTQAVAHMTNTPEGLVASIQLTCVGQDTVSATGSLEASVDSPSRIQSCTARALDAQERVLFETDQDFAIDIARAPIVNPAQDDTLWIVLGVVGGVLVIGGAVTIGILASPQDAMLGAPTVTGWPR